MGLVRFETDDHHSQTVLGTHHIEDVTPHEGDDQHVDIRITDGRVFVVRETMASVGDKLAAHGVFLPLQRSAEPKRERKPLKVNLPPQAAPEAQSVVVSEQVSETSELISDQSSLTPAQSTPQEDPTEQSPEPPVNKPKRARKSNVNKQTNASPEAQPAAEGVVSPPTEAGTES